MGVGRVQLSGVVDSDEIVGVGFAKSTINEGPGDLTV